MSVRQTRRSSRLRSACAIGLLLAACKDDTPPKPATPKTTSTRSVVPSSQAPAVGNPTRRDSGHATSSLGALSKQLSEPEQAFFSENLVSNEAAYLDSAPALLSSARAWRERDIAYLGVGPEQNLTFISLLRPRIAFVIDIRRDNLLQHLLFKSLFLDSDNPGQWLATLLGRRWREPTEPQRDKTGSDLAELLRHVDALPRDASIHAALVQSTLRRMREQWQFEIQQTDDRRLTELCAAFFQGQLDSRFETTSERPDFPTLQQLLLAKDPTGQHRSFLSDPTQYLWLRAFQQRDSLVPVTGDLAGPHALQAIADWLRTERIQVGLLYASNVE